MKIQSEDSGIIKYQLLLPEVAKKYLGGGNTRTKPGFPIRGAKKTCLEKILN